MSQCLEAESMYSLGCRWDLGSGLLWYIMSSQVSRTAVAPRMQECDDLKLHCWPVVLFVVTGWFGCVGCNGLRK